MNSKSNVGAAPRGRPSAGQAQGPARTAAPRGCPDKKEAVVALNGIYQIAERLYRKDPARFRPVYGWIGAQVKQQRDILLVLRAVERLEEKCRGDPPVVAQGWPGGLPVQDVVPYLGGTLRKLEAEEAAKKIRASGATIGELLRPLLKRHSRFRGNPRRGKG